MYFNCSREINVVVLCSTLHGLWTFLDRGSGSKGCRLYGGVDSMLSDMGSLVWSGMILRAICYCMIPDDQLCYGVV